jgi:hypothetical protein
MTTEPNSIVTDECDAGYCCDCGSIELGVPARMLSWGSVLGTMGLGLHTPMFTEWVSELRPMTLWPLPDRFDVCLPLLSLAVVGWLMVAVAIGLSRYRRFEIVRGRGDERLDAVARNAPIAGRMPWLLMFGMGVVAAYLVVHLLVLNYASDLLVLFGGR